MADQLVMTLGRKIEHDERSKAFPAATAPLATVHHVHHGGTLDQGQLGSCTGNASAQHLATEPVWRKGVQTSEKKALKIYELATTLDAVPGSYPPDDTGSTGLAVAKACQQLGYIKSYTHAFGIDHARGAIAVSPFICGTNWYQEMFTPDGQGFVHPAGSIAGGHEYLCLGYNEADDSFEFLNSWSAKWGVALPESKVTGGGFKMRAIDFAALLSQQGDITVFQAA